MSQPKLNSVTPVLQVTNLQRAVDFYRDVLGFTQGWVYGEPQWITAMYRDVVELHLYVVDKPVPSHFYLNVTGVEAYFGSAVSAGAKVVHPLENRHYGMRDGRVEDPDGNQIGIGENLEGEDCPP